MGWSSRCRRHRGGDGAAPLRSDGGAPRDGTVPARDLRRSPASCSMGARRTVPDCLGILPGEVRRLRRAASPHRLERHRRRETRSPVRWTAHGALGYFVHSYAPVPDDPALVVATAEYDGPFVAAVRWGGVRCPVPSRAERRHRSPDPGQLRRFNPFWRHGRGNGRASDARTCDAADQGHPCLDVAGGRVVKGVNFVDLVDEGDPVELAARYTAEGADEICYLDIGAAPEERATSSIWCRRTAREVFVPLTVGGGVRSPDDMRAVLRRRRQGGGQHRGGVRSRLIDRCAAAFGRQCVVLAVDARSSTAGRWRWWSTAAGHQPGATPSAGSPRGWSGEPVRSCSPRSTVTAPTTATTWTCSPPWPSRRFPSSPRAAQATQPTSSMSEGGASAVLAASTLHRRTLTITRSRGARHRRYPGAGSGVIDPDAVVWDERGLVPRWSKMPPAGRVLMVAWMDRTALTTTIASGQAHFWSRARAELWRKGATSGNTMEVVGIGLDCDGDTVLMTVSPAGPACHTGTTSCFDGAGHADPGFDPRAFAGSGGEAGRATPEGPYTVELLDGGVDRVARKVLEEAGEPPSAPRITPPGSSGPCGGRGGRRALPLVGAFRATRGRHIGRRWRARGPFSMMVRPRSASPAGGPRRRRHDPRGAARA